VRLIAVDDTDRPIGPMHPWPVATASIRESQEQQVVQAHAMVKEARIARTISTEHGACVTEPHRTDRLATVAMARRGRWWRWMNRAAPVR